MTYAENIRTTEISSAIGAAYESNWESCLSAAYRAGDEAPSDTVGGLFAKAVSRCPDRIFLKHANGSRTTYREASVRVAVTMKRLEQLGLEPGDRIICYIEETIPLSCFVLACALKRIVPVPLSPTFSCLYLKKLVQRAGSEYVFTTASLALQLLKLGLQPLCYRAHSTSVDGIEDLEDYPTISSKHALEMLQDAARHVSDQDLFMIQPTSGSTGEPKLVQRRHLGFTRYATNVGREIVEDEESPRFLAVNALTHAFGLHMFTTALAMGAEIAVPTDIDTKASLDEVRVLDPTILPMVPRVLQSLYTQHLQQLSRPEDSPFFGPSARFLLSAGGRSHAELMHFVCDQGVEVIEFYGSSEASLIALTPRGKWREGYVGRVVSDATLKVAEDGELLVRSQGLMTGYYRDKRLTRSVYTRDEFYRTGDLGEVTPDGYVRILGRKRDVFNTLEGSNIYPERIENMLEALPWVHQAALVGDQRPYVTAFIVLKDLPRGDIDTRGYLDSDIYSALYDRAYGDLDAINITLEKIERIGAIALFGYPFDPKTYAVVGSAKIRRDRRAFAERYKAEIAALYPEPVPRGSQGPQ